jgi:hypothetical protein
MSLPYRTTGNAKPWIVNPRPMDASMRRHAFGPVQPMEYPGLFARLWRIWK